MARRSAHGLASLVEERPLEALEQLDVAARVVPLRGWFTLAAAFLAVGVLAHFAFRYQVPLKVDGKGILLARRPAGSDPLLQVTAPASGRVARIDVAIGSTVRAGDVVAEIDQKELEDDVASAEAELDRLRDEDTRMSQLDAEDSRIQTEAQLKVENALVRQIALDQERFEIQRKFVASDQRLKTQGILTERTALESKAAVDALESTIVANQARVFEHLYNHHRDQTIRRRDATRRQLAVQAAETRLGLLRGRVGRDTKVVSPYDGRVVDLMITPLGAVAKGTAAVLLQPISNDPAHLEAIVFVPAGLGKRVHIGDSVEVSPDTIRRQEHGFIRGEVRTVSEIPCTDQAMLAELKHPALVASLIEKYHGQVLLNIHIGLREVNPLPDGSEGRPALNRLDWSSSTGRQQWVSGGTPCSTWIVVERRPLIALAMPWFKSLIGYN